MSCNAYQLSHPTVWYGPLGVQGSVNATLKGSGMRKPDGTYEGELAGELEAKGELKAGIPMVLTGNAALSVTAKVSGVKASWSDKGFDWSALEGALVGKLTLSVNLLDLNDIHNFDPPEDWRFCNQKLFEYSPTGELELLVAKLTGTQGLSLSAGKDLDTISAKIDELGSWAEALNPFSDGAVRRKIARGEHHGADTMTRVGMIKTLMSGACLGDDEKAIIEVLDASSERGDLQAVLEGVGRKELLAKVDDDKSSASKLSAYLRPLVDVTGAKQPGRFFRHYTVYTPLDAGTEAVKLEQGTVWLCSRKTIEMAAKNPAMKAHLGAHYDKAQCSLEAWFPAHGKSGAVAASTNNTTAFTLWYNSKGAAEAEPADPFSKPGKIHSAQG